MQLQWEQTDNKMVDNVGLIFAALPRRSLTFLEESTSQNEWRRFKLARVWTLSSFKPSSFQDDNWQLSTLMAKWVNLIIWCVRVLSWVEFIIESDFSWTKLNRFRWVIYIKKKYCKWRVKKIISVNLSSGPYLTT
jgi:hypothetical protein